VPVADDLVRKPTRSCVDGQCLRRILVHRAGAMLILHAIDWLLSMPARNVSDLIRNNNERRSFFVKIVAFQGKERERETFYANKSCTNLKDTCTYYVEMSSSQYRREC
jgi:hypothetical protein